jgi:hypothetical protein
MATAAINDDGRSCECSGVIAAVTVFLASQECFGKRRRCSPRKKSAAITNTPLKVSTAPKDLFLDVTRAAARFSSTRGSKGKNSTSSKMQRVAPRLDYDNDGRMDILLVMARRLRVYRARRHPSRLYRNQHDGTLIDVSAKSGLNFAVNTASRSGISTTTDGKLFISAALRFRFITNNHTAPRMSPQRRASQRRSLSKKRASFATMQSMKV